MERFTRKENTYYEKAIARLQELEDKLESGLLVELPCKVGDKVYDDYENPYCEWTVINIIFYGYGKRMAYTLVCEHDNYHGEIYFSSEDFGLKWFATKEEVELKRKTK